MTMPADLATYMINMPASVSRRQRMEVQFGPLGLAPEILPGVDGRGDWARLVQSVDMPAFRRNVGRAVLPGEIGCYHAHLAVWRRFLESDAAVALVLEDDVVFHPEFPAALAAALAARAQWDLVKLNRIRARAPVRQGRAGHWQFNAYLGPFTGMGAYLITRPAAARLLPALLPITRPIDHELDRSHVHDLRHFGLEPFPSHVEDAGESTITGSGFAEVRKFPWYRRLPVHGLRLANLIGKSAHLARRGGLWPWSGPSSGPVAGSGAGG